MQRFFIPHPTGYQIDQVITFPDELAHQIRSVLRMSVGGMVFVLDNEGGLYEVALTAVTRTHVTGKVLAKQTAPGELAVKITLFQSLTKRDKFEWILQKGTELGVDAFVPIVTQRSLVQDVKIKSNKLTRWQKIVTEAAEQSHRGKCPTVANPSKLDDAIEQSRNFDLALIAWVAEKQESLKSILQQHPDAKTIALFIGPEGGFTEEEVENGRNAGIIPFTLGNRILRTETAALAATTIILHESGEFA